MYQWLARQPIFAERYRSACSERADSLADELTDIADDPVTAAGMTREEIEWRKLRIHTRMWVASKLRPARWGDYQPQAQAGTVTINIGIPPAQPVTVVENAPDQPPAPYVHPMP